MAEVGSLQVDHSYKRVVESWFPDLVAKEQPQKQTSDEAARTVDVGKDEGEVGSNRREKSPKKLQKKQQPVPMATKIGSLVEGKILPKLKKQQKQQQQEKKGLIDISTADAKDNGDDDSKVKVTSLSQSQRKQQAAAGQEGDGHKMSRNQKRRMKKRQKKFEQQASGTQEMASPVAGQFPTLEHLLQSPSKLSQGNLKVEEFPETQEKSTDKQNNSSLQSSSQRESKGAKQEALSPLSAEERNDRKAGNTEIKFSSTGSHTGVSVKADLSSTGSHTGVSAKTENLVDTSQGEKDDVSRKSSTPQIQEGQKNRKKEPKSPDAKGNVNKRTVQGSPQVLPGLEKIKDELRSPTNTTDKSDKGSSQQTPPVETGLKNIKKEPKTSGSETKDSSKATIQNLVVSDNTGDRKPLKSRTSESEDVQSKILGASGAVDVVRPKKRKRKRRRSSGEAPLSDLAVPKEDTEDLKKQVNLSPTGNMEQVGKVEGEANTPDKAKKRRKRKRAKKVVTSGEKESQVSPEPSQKKAKLSYQPDLVGGAAQQTIGTKDAGLQSASPGQEVKPAKKAKKRLRQPASSVEKEAGKGEMASKEEIPAKKQRLSTDDPQVPKEGVAKSGTGVEPAGPVKRKRNSRRRRRKRTTSEQSQSSEGGASVQVKPAITEGVAEGTSKPEESVATSSPKKRKRRRKKHKQGESQNET